jgi:iron(III) transport system permease protein
VGPRQDSSQLSGTAPSRASAGRWRLSGRKPTVESVICIAASALLAWLVLYPLSVLLIGSLRTDLPMRPGRFTSANFVALFADPDNLQAILNTVISSGLATLLAVAIGMTLAWLTSRTDTPARAFFDNAFVLPYYLSPFIGAIAWTLLANPRIGFINNLFTEALGFERAPLNVYTVAGLVFVMALYYSPIVFLFVAGALRSMDPALEEAAHIHGASAFGTVMRVTLPLMTPAIASSALLVFLNAAGQFGIPAVIGIPMHFDVITTRIWVGLGYFPPRYTEAAAFAMVLLGFSAIIVFFQQRYLARRSFVTVTGRGYRPGLTRLGWTRPVALAACVLYLLLSIVLPYGALVFTSFQPYLSFAFEPGQWTFKQYADVLFENPETVRAIRNSLVLAAGGATATILLSLIISYVVIRTRLRARFLLDYLATLPAAIPAVVFAVALLWSYIFLPLPIYGTMWMLLIAYVSHYIPFGVRAASAGLVQIGPELEESARIHGATWLGSLRRIVVPLLKPALTAGWILMFIEIIRSLSLSILLYSNDSIVMPVVIYDLYETGAYPALSAFSVLQTVMVFAAIYGAKKVARLDSFMELR